MTERIATSGEQRVCWNRNCGSRWTAPVNDCPTCGYPTVQAFIEELSQEGEHIILPHIAARLVECLDTLKAALPAAEQSEDIARLSAASAAARTAEQRRAEWEALPKCECSGDPSHCKGFYNCKRKKCAGNCVLPGWVHFDCPTHGPGGEWKHLVEVARREGFEAGRLASATERSDAIKDTARLNYLANELSTPPLWTWGKARIYASAFGRTEPNENDNLAALRDAVDEVMCPTDSRREDV